MKGLLKDRGIKKVYIIGAGFSAPLGMPLMPEILKETYKVALTQDWTIERNKCPFGQATYLIKKLRYFFPLEKFTHENIKKGIYPPNFDVEKFISYAYATSAYGENFSQRNDHFIWSLKRWIGEAILDRQFKCFNDSIPIQYTSFIKELHGSIVLTFNWDTVLETLLDQNLLTYGFDILPALNKGVIPIIKLHGSIDWFTELNKLISNKSLTSHKRILGIKNHYRVYNNLKDYYDNYCSPQIVIPAYDKISQVINLGEIWSAPERFFHDKLDIIIIGFSMRPDDHHSRAFIYPQLVAGSREGNLRIKVIDFANNEEKKKEIRARYIGVENCQFWYDGFNENVWEFIKN